MVARPIAPTDAEPAESQDFGVCAVPMRPDAQMGNVTPPNCPGCESMHARTQAPHLLW